MSRGTGHLQPEGWTSEEVALWWDKAEDAYHAGRLPRARRFLRWIVICCPDDEDAWLWMARLASTPGERLVYLCRAHAFHPHSARVQAALRQARNEQLESAVGELKSRRALLRCLPDDRHNSGRNGHSRD